MIYLFFWIEVILLLGLTCFGLHRLWLLVLFLKHRRNPRVPKQYWRDVPTVTIQLPIYNEPFVVERLLESVAKIDYPRDRLEIQILDDSTDDTLAILEHKVKKLQDSGLAISLIHRNHRREYKAGALAEGLVVAKGEFLAIFDADFVPPADFLRKTIHYFTDAKTGMVQMRWEHLNRGDSYLTEAQALWLDAHFRVEQVARSRAGYWFNFNGSAGIWRKQAVISAGGWQGDTLTEDLDLSYRAQLVGWRGVYLDDVSVPAELPTEMNALKSQQHRWAKGTIQTAMKLLPLILRSRLPWHQKLEVCFHLGNWLHFILAVFLVFLAFPSILIHQRVLCQNTNSQLCLISTVESLLGFFVILSAILFYSVSQKGRIPWWKTLRDIPWIMAISMGLSLNNSRAIVQAVSGKGSSFIRTPKGNGRTGFRDRQRIWPAEVFVACYVMAMIIYAFTQQLYSVIPFLIPPLIGFFHTGVSIHSPKPG